MSASPEEVVGRLLARGETVAVAESVTGGLVAGAITRVPGCSLVFRGAVVAYATELKHELLGVPAQQLATDGPVHERTARSMAEGVRRLLGATWGVATTGVAGPDPQDGHPPGILHVALRGPSMATARTLHLDGHREAVRIRAVAAALDLLAAALPEGRPPGESGSRARG